MSSALEGCGPHRVFEARHSGLRHRRDIRRGGGAGGASHGERFQLAKLSAHSALESSGSRSSHREEDAGVNIRPIKGNINEVNYPMSRAFLNP